jgi:hypothetical protein
MTLLAIFILTLEIVRTHLTLQNHPATHASDGAGMTVDTRFVCATYSELANLGG